MAQPIRRKDQKRRAAKQVELPLKKENFVVIGIGLCVITLGYIAMSAGPVEGFLPLVLAPILLVTGYCVIIPIGILYRGSYLGFMRRKAAPGGEPQA